MLNKYIFILSLVLSSTLLFAQENSAQLKKYFQTALQLSVKHNECKKALPIWEKLYKKQPTSFSISNNYAACLIKINKISQAKQILESIIQTNKQQSQVWDNLNKIYAYEANVSYQEIFNKKITPLKAEFINQLSKEQNRQVDNSDVLKAIKKWSDNWSEQNLSEYLNSYSKHFIPNHGVNLKTWQQQRRRNIKRPKYIRVSISNIYISKPKSNIALVYALQSYKSDRYEDKIYKVWLWHKNSKGWTIIKEMPLINFNPL